MFLLVATLFDSEVVFGVFYTKIIVVWLEFAFEYKALIKLYNVFN